MAESERCVGVKYSSWVRRRAKHASGRTLEGRGVTAPLPDGDDAAHNSSGHRGADELAADPQGNGGRWETAFGYSRNFLSNRFVYVVVSPRARGLSVGINLNPDRKCNFRCVYCEVDREAPVRDSTLDVPVMIEELRKTLALSRDGRLHTLTGFNTLPAELLEFQHVTLSGDAEPTLAPNFCEAVHAVVHLRALGELPFFKVILLTNASALDQPSVRNGLNALTLDDEIWLKLDGGTENYIRRINRPRVPVEKIFQNILEVGRHRPIVIQSLFPKFAGEQPSAEEIDAFVERLKSLQSGGANISMVQVYSAMRPIMDQECRHLPLKSLSRIAQTVRAGTGLRVEVF